MNQILLKLHLLIAIIACPKQNYAWGFFAHQLINELAVYALPPELFGFYKQHIGYLKAHALDPDKRRYINPKEAGRHYIDIDHYEHSSPIDTIPEMFAAAIQKYSIDTLLKHGSVPWQIQFTLNNLEDAFCHNNLAQILKLSADLGHYMADAHVPLHNTANYNGQFTGQIGIHALFESRLPELFASQYQSIVSRAEYINNPLRFTWNSIREGYALLPAVFEKELQVRKKIAPKNHFGFVRKGKKWVKIWSFEYAEAYHNALNGMVEQRMMQAVYAIACMWYTAWINAGQPVLISTFIPPNPLPDSLTNSDEMNWFDRGHDSIDLILESTQ